MAIQPLDGDFLVAIYLTKEAGDGQAGFDAFDHLFTGLDDLRVSDHVQCARVIAIEFAAILVIGQVDDNQTLADGNLRGGHEKNAKEVDTPIAGLLTDLRERGLLKDTLVLWGGEFGRTPVSQGKDGRDHNPQGFTMWLAGGGVKGGLTFGATDEFGYYAVKDKVHMHDLHATILHLLGLDHERLTYRYAGRDFRLTDVNGRVAKEIFS